MATTGKPLGRSSVRRRRRIGWLALLAGLLALAWNWSAIVAQAEAGAAYGARIACSCRFIGGRPLDDCAKDFMPGMSLVTLSEDAQAKRVTARVFPLASETVRYRQGPGCMFEPGS
jgi:hypothetical protein